MQLTKFDAARRAIIEAASVDELKSIRDKAEAARAYCKQAGEGLEMQNRCAEIKLRAERRAGQMLAEMRLNGGDRKSESHDARVKLSDLDITASQSSRWQKIASLRDELFESFLSETIEKRRELTTSAALKLSKQAKAAEVSECEPLTEAFTVDDLLDTGRQFATIYADPPWQYGNQGTRAATNNHYPTMPIDDICNLPIADIAAEKALLFIWTTNGFLEDTLNRVIPAWGFTFKSSMVWVKPQMGIGNYVRNAHEFLLIANRGGLLPNGKSQISWIEADRKAHSAKPDAFRHAVEKMGPAPRIELFSRQEMQGWTSWGNQVRAMEATLL